MKGKRNVSRLGKLLKPHSFENVKPFLEIVKTTFDMIVLFVMLWAIFISRDSNQIARESLQRSNTPWLKINGIGVDEKSQIRYVLANYSDSPALRLKIYLFVDGINKGEPKTYSIDALMPHDSGTFSFSFSGDGGVELSRQLNSGKKTLRFEISYESIEGKIIVIEQEVRWGGDMFRDVKYEVK